MIFINVLIWVTFGFLAGWVASVIDTDTEENSASTKEYLMIGVLGAVLSGALFRTVGGLGSDQFNLVSLFIAITGSSLMLALYYRMKRLGDNDAIHD
ncbi:MAG: GlsB/YeaQ/YmgE family stress response membrane protein [bacterium]|nr:GlsB/YeaQ/YmgE family stress response membrane protein [bacterium]